MISFCLTIAPLDPNDPRNWYKLVQSLCNTRAHFINLMVKDEESVYEPIIDLLVEEMNNILNALRYHDVSIIPDMDATVVIERDGKVSEMTYAEFITLISSNHDDQSLN